MKIAFFSELPFTGNTDRSHANMRTEFAWFTALNATHVSFRDIKSHNQNYDLGIVIFPKKLMDWTDVDIVSEIRKYCKRTAFMQEGPSWYFQDLPLEQSLWFYEQMMSVDIVFAHNDVDLRYYAGLLEKPCYINPTLMIEDLVKDLPNTAREHAIIGGNFVRWYGGLNSHAVAQEFGTEIWAPQMGRMPKEELGIAGLNHLPYLNWKEWIYKLNQFKYAVHLNPNSIAGTFSLNCAFLGIPCIGSIHTDTQRLCFPDLSVEPTDLHKAKYLATKLKIDTEFYNAQSASSKVYYKQYFCEESYLQHWGDILASLD
jgi:hypothetical protein